MTMLDTLKNFTCAKEKCEDPPPAEGEHVELAGPYHANVVTTAMLDAFREEIRQDMASLRGRASIGGAHADEEAPTRESAARTQSSMVEEFQNERATCPNANGFHAVMFAYAFPLTGEPSARQTHIHWRPICWLRARYRAGRRR